MKQTDIDFIYHPTSFTRKKKIWFSFKVYVRQIFDAIKRSKNIIGYDPTHKDKFYLICTDERGVYRAHTDSTNCNFLKIKFVMASILRWNWHYRDVMRYVKLQRKG